MIDRERNAGRQLQAAAQTPKPESPCRSQYRDAQPWSARHGLPFARGATHRSEGELALEPWRSPPSDCTHSPSMHGNGKLGTHG